MLHDVIIFVVGVLVGEVVMAFLVVMCRRLGEMDYEPEREPEKKPGPEEK